MFKIIVQGVLIIGSLYIIGFFPALTVASTAVAIVLLFLVLGKE